MMDQANVDYLFQVTAALAERTATSLSAAADRNAPPFDVHFAQASESAAGASWYAPQSTRQAFDRPQERPAFESEPSGSYASEENSESPEYGGCAETTEGTNCGDADPNPHDDADSTLQSPAGTIDPPASHSESHADADSSDSDESNSPEGRESETSPGNDRIESISTSQALTESTMIEAGPVVTASNVETPPSSDAAAVSPEQDKVSGVRTEVQATRTNGPELTPSAPSSYIEPELKVDGAVTSAPPVATGSVEDVDGSEVRQSPAKATDRTQQFVPPRGLTTKSHGEQSTDVTAKAAEKTSSNRRTNATNAQVDDAERRATEGNDSRTVQRSASTVAVNQLVGAAVLNAATSDAHSGPASTHGDDSSAAVAKSIGTKTDLLAHTLTRPQRGHAGAGRAAPADGTPALPRVDAARFVGRVAKAIRTATERGGALHLRLSPPELGSLRLQLMVDNGVMSVTLEADNSAARQVLLDHLPALRDRLAEQNIRIERFDVDVRQEGSGGQADARASQQDERNQQPPETNHVRRPRRSPSGEELPRVTDAVPSRITNNGINVLA